MLHLTQGAIVTRRTSSFIIAECFNGKHKMRVDYARTNSEGHARAAMALVRKLATEYVSRHKPQGGGTLELINAPQCGEWVAGDMPEGSGFAFVYAGETNRSSGIEKRGFVQNCELPEY